MNDHSRPSHTCTLCHFITFLFPLKNQKSISLFVSPYYELSLCCSRWLQFPHIFLQKKSDISRIWTKYNCDRKVFTLNGVKCIKRNSGKISPCTICFRLFAFKDGCHPFSRPVHPSERNVSFSLEVNWSRVFALPVLHCDI